MLANELTGGAITLLSVGQLASQGCIYGTAGTEGSKLSAAVSMTVMSVGCAGSMLCLVLAFGGRELECVNVMGWAWS